MPVVQLSAAHEKSCVVKVGDKFPSAALPDSSGKVQELDKLRGRYTLVVFWTANESAALEQLVDIEQMIWPAYKSLGLQVIAINPVDGNTPAAKAKLAPLKLSFPLLNDAKWQVLWHCRHQPFATHLFVRQRWQDSVVRFRVFAHDATTIVYKH